MILVTGGTGMIGSRLLYDLAKAGHGVRALKRKGSDTRLFDRYTQHSPLLREKVEWMDGDLLELDSLEKACRDVDTVFHCAAMVSFVPGEAALMEKVNMEGTANLVNTCLCTGHVSYFAHVSSVATLGRTSGDSALDENTHWDPATHPSQYAISKYGAEREVWRGIAEGLPGVIVNPSIVLGPGDFNKGSAALFKKIKNGFPFYTEGISGFVDVRDVSDALLFLWNKKVYGERFILNSENLSYKQLFDLMAHAMKTKAPYFHVRRWMASLFWPIEKVRCQLMGGKPFITRETARTAGSRYYYSAEKIKTLGFQFRNIGDCISHTLPYLEGA